jgi:ATP-dependent protease ClpP protease subunit
MLYLTPQQSQEYGLIDKVLEAEEVADPVPVGAS